MFIWHYVLHHEISCIGGEVCCAVREAMESLEIREIRNQVGYRVRQGAKTTVFNYSRDFFVKCLSSTTWYTKILHITVHLPTQPSESVLISLLLHSYANPGLWTSDWYPSCIPETLLHYSKQNYFANDLPFRLICFHDFQQNSISEGNS